eukprot:9094867-Alexandrium_andersonii.AAC.1
MSGALDALGPVMTCECQFPGPGTGSDTCAAHCWPLQRVSAIPGPGTGSDRHVLHTAGHSNGRMPFSRALEPAHM